MNDKERKEIEENVKTWEENGLLESMEEVLEKQLIDNIPPNKLRLLMKALEALNLDELNEKQKISKILSMVVIQLVSPEFDNDHVMEICTIWKLHFDDKLPTYAYEEAQE